MSILPPIIQLIHGSDATQHTGELRSILDRMKSEKRISDFAALDISVNSGHINIKNEDHQGIIVLLTNEIERVRSDIEKMLKDLIVDKPNVKLIEIIIDNLPYHNNFISFPQDLMPIRSRDDMNLVWNGIEKDLKAIFPKPPEKAPEVEIVEKKDSKIFLKVLCVSVMTGVLSIICVVFLTDNNYIFNGDVSFLAPVIFSFLLPIIIFLRHRKDFEWFTLPEGQKRLEGAVNWKQFLISSAIALLVLFMVIWLISSENDYFAGGSVIGVATVLPLLLYRRKAGQIKAPGNRDQIQPPARKYLESLGRYVIFFLVGMVYWWAVLVTLDLDNGLPLLFIMPLVTTIGIFIIRFRQKRARPFP